MIFAHTNWICVSPVAVNLCHKIYILDLVELVWCISETIILLLVPWQNILYKCDQSVGFDCHFERVLHQMTLVLKCLRFKNLAQRLVILTEILLWFWLVFQITGMKHISLVQVMLHHCNKKKSIGFMWQTSHMYFTSLGTGLNSDTKIASLVLALLVMTLCVSWKKFACAWNIKTVCDRDSFQQCIQRPASCNYKFEYLNCLPLRIEFVYHKFFVIIITQDSA